MAGFDLMELLLQPGGMNPSAGIGPGGLNWTTPGYLARPEAGPEAQDIDLLSLLAPRPNVEQPQLNRFQRFAAGLSRLPIRFSLGPSAGAGANVGAGLYGLLSAIGTPYAQEQDRARAAQRAVDEQNRDLTMAARRLGIASALRRAEAKNKPAEVSEARLRSGLLGPEAQKAYEESVRRTQVPREGRRTPTEVQADAAAAERGRRAVTPVAGQDDMSWVQGLVHTARTGKRFVDVSELIGKEKGAAVKWATQQGLPAVGKDQMAELRDQETARGNIEGMLGQLQGLLPKDAAGRVASAPGIRLSAMLQTNAQRAAFNAWRGAAIRNLRAIAGSRGFRITEAEIKLAVKNDIPTINDTWPAAQAKMANVTAMLDNAELPLLEKDWRAGSKPKPGGFFERVIGPVR